jgi:ribosomal protein L10
MRVVKHAGSQGVSGNRLLRTGRPETEGKLGTLSGDEPAAARGQGLLERQRQAGRYQVDRAVLSAKDLDKVASLPTRLQALSQLLGVMKAPIQKFVGTLAAPNQKLVWTLVAIRDAKQTQAAA